MKLVSTVRESLKTYHANGQKGFTKQKSIVSKMCNRTCIVCEKVCHNGSSISLLHGKVDNFP